mmetsp:Transcript_7021/g.11737  ORF Transcript_7021/g.11737 Transcript_7021/m.11737 type:complete len:571 (-) Transcript_7021:95-1807(-)
MSSANEPVFELGRQSKQNESTTPSHPSHPPSLSSSVLSSLNGSSSVISSNSQRREGEEQRKKSKKHKHDKDKSRHSSRKKRRHGNSIVQSSKIAIATAENAIRQSQDIHSNSQVTNDSSFNQNGVAEGASRSSIFNGKSSTGYDFSMPLQFLHQSHPFSSTERVGTEPVPVPGLGGGVRGDMGVGGGSVFSSMMVPGSGMSARNAAHHALFMGSGMPSSIPPTMASHQSNMFQGSLPYSLLTEEQFRLHNQAININAANGGALQVHPSTDGVVLQESNSNLANGTFGLISSSRSGENSAVSTIHKESSGARICAQNTVTNVSINDLRALFHLTLVEASKHLGMCTTLFKKICRKKNIEKWPYRKIHSLMNKVESLEHYLQDNGSKIPESVKKSYREQISNILDKVNDIKENTGVANMESTQTDVLSLSEGSVYGSTSRGNEREKRSQSSTTASSNEMTSESGSDCADGARKRRRYETTYDIKTGWVANCSTCGKLGKYRHPSQGRVFQHSSGTGKYCGYFRDNPRQEGESTDMLDSSRNNKAVGSEALAVATSVAISSIVPKPNGSNSSV